MPHMNISNLMHENPSGQDASNLQAAWRMIRRQLAGESDDSEAKTILQFLRNEEVTGSGQVLESFGYQELFLEYWVDPTRQTVLVRFLGEEAICNTKDLADELEKVLKIYEESDKTP